MEKTVGAIYPVPAHLFERLFDGEIKVFVKYLAHTATKLNPKHKIIFYASKSSRKLIGEGTIQRVEFLRPNEVLTRYKNDLFLTEAEFHAYVNRSPSRSNSKQMLTLVLKNLRKYQRPVEYASPMTMAGQYITSEDYAIIIKKMNEH